MIDSAIHAKDFFLGNYDDCDKLNYNPDKPRLKDILWDNLDWIQHLYDTGKLRDTVLDNVQNTLLCKTEYLGYDMFECPSCGNFNIIYHHCHSRLCTSCGTKYQKQLAVKAESMCLDVRHRHIVFTIPEQYRFFFRKNRNALDLLFVAARNTIMKITNENIFKSEKRKRGKTGRVRNDKDNYYLYRNFKDSNRFGMIATLHTFGRSLQWNPHIHCLVPELIYTPSTDSCKRFNYFNFTSLRKTWQYEITRLLSQFYKAEFDRCKNKAYRSYDKGFYVYAKSDRSSEDSDTTHTENIKGCVNYMMRYASRPAMAESRITSFDKATHEVIWYYDDHKTEERITVKESGRELLKKIFIHVPEKHFRMIRYYGFYNNKCQDLLNHIHELLGKERKKDYSKEARDRLKKRKLNKLKYRTAIRDTYNRDVLLCSCGCIMNYIDTYNPLEGITNDRYYRQTCIDEMRKMRLSRVHIRGRTQAHFRPSAA